MEDTYLVLTGMKVVNKDGTFYFSEPGNWIDDEGYPIWKKLHRDDGPAAEYSNGNKYWYVMGKPHRTDGPAIEVVDGPDQWWVDGKRLTEPAFDRWHSRNMRSHTPKIARITPVHTTARIAQTHNSTHSPNTQKAKQRRDQKE